jgi:hypothetical protein
MNGKQKAVLWLGLIMVGLNLVLKWSEIRDVIFGGAGITPPPSTGTQPATGGGNSIQIPITILPNGPKITVPKL